MSNVQFASQMNFLQTHAENYEQRKLRIESIDGRLNQLEPMLDEFKKLEKEKEDLQRLNKDEKKFLITMNEMVLRNTGEPFSNGPLFENQNKEDEDGEKETA